MTGGQWWLDPKTNPEAIWLKQRCRDVYAAAHDQDVAAVSSGIADVSNRLGGPGLWVLCRALAEGAARWSGARQTHDVIKAAGVEVMAAIYADKDHDCPDPQHCEMTQPGWQTRKVAHQFVVAHINDDLDTLDALFVLTGSDSGQTTLTTALAALALRYAGPWRGSATGKVRQVPPLFADGDPA